MRLIDADKVKQFPYSPESGTEDMVEEWIYECGLYDLKLYVTDECPVDIEQALKDLCRKAIEGFMNIIDTEPTAYDVEKVEEELLNKREIYRIREIESLHKGEPLNIGVNLAKQACIEDCIETVKRGGVECLTMKMM